MRRPPRVRTGPSKQGTALSSNLSVLFDGQGTLVKIAQRLDCSLQIHSERVFRPRQFHMVSSSTNSWTPNQNLSATSLIAFALSYLSVFGPFEAASISSQREPNCFLLFVSIRFDKSKRIAWEFDRDHLRRSGFAIPSDSWDAPNPPSA